MKWVSQFVNATPKPETPPVDFRGGEMREPGAWRRTEPLWIGIAVLLLALGLAGMGYLAWYKNQAGASGTPAASFPQDSRLVLSAQHATLLVFVHPHCPCSRATLQELSRIMTVCRDRVAARIVFIRPTGSDSAWMKTDLWKSAESITGAEVIEDRDGAEGRRFGVSTSGHVFLYDPTGSRRFSGGITGARGHEGDNPGEDAVVSIVSGKHSGCASAPVFGCALFSGSDNQGARP